MKDTAMSNRPIKPYRILLTEIRVYEIEIGSDTDYDLEQWASEGWNDNDPDRDPEFIKLVSRRLAKVTVHEKTELPWGNKVKVEL